MVWHMAKVIHPKSPKNQKSSHKQGVPPWGKDIVDHFSFLCFNPTWRWKTTYTPPLEADNQHSACLIRMKTVNHFCYVHYHACAIELRTPALSHLNPFDKSPAIRHLFAVPSSIPKCEAKVVICTIPWFAQTGRVSSQSIKSSTTPSTCSSFYRKPSFQKWDISRLCLKSYGEYDHIAWITTSPTPDVGEWLRYFAAYQASSFMFQDGRSIVLSGYADD
jgi:hypothetical protein